MKVPPLHAFLTISVLIFVLVLVIIVVKSSYDSGGPAVGGQSPIDMGSFIIYGSNGCGWCQKQKNYMDKKGISFTFVDCQSETCPDFVKSFPTIMQNGNVMQPTGYSEFAGPLSI
jgi:glutaredoxin